MIQIKRGSTDSWEALKMPLADGQPGYNKTTHELKIGDGRTLWKDLAVINSQVEIASGKLSPEYDNKSDFYAVYDEHEQEIDFVISLGIKNEWVYKKWKSGLVQCWITAAFTAENTDVWQQLGTTGLYCFNTGKIEYPFEFEIVPTEIVTLQNTSTAVSPVWLASKSRNTKNTSGIYSCISVEQPTAMCTFHVAIEVTGYVKRS